MNNNVSFETAKKLKEAGFPQPEPEVGQVWYDEDGNMVWIRGLRENSYSSRRTASFVGELKGGGMSTCTAEEMAEAGWVFAPTATDILRELPFGRGLHFDAGFFSVRVLRLNDSELIVDSVHENPAEACAPAYLAKHPVGNSPKTPEL